MNFIVFVFIQSVMFLTTIESANPLIDDQLDVMKNDDVLNQEINDLYYNENELYLKNILDLIEIYGDEINRYKLFNDELDEGYGVSNNLIYEDLMKKPRHERKRCKICLFIMTRWVNYAKKSKVS